MTETSSTRSIVLTPPGAGAIGVVRVTGPDALAIVGEVFRPASGEPAEAAGAKCAPVLEIDRLRYGWFEVDGETIDNVIVTRVGGCEVATVDISAHGGVRVIERILQALERFGAPLAEANAVVEPHWPAYGLIDQEAIQLMWRAKTERALRFLVWQRRHLASKLEDVARLCRTDERRAGGALKAMLARYDAARTLLDGATVVLLGPPNSGKSTLFNRLLGRPATVVSPHPGTTRDWVSHAAELKGVPLTLVDTAGRRENARSVERQAIERGETVAVRADLRLIVVDGSQALPSGISTRWKAYGLLPSDLVVVNKVDLGAVWDPAALLPTCSDGSVRAIRISALTGAGMEALVQGVVCVLGLNQPIEAKACLFTSRQKAVAEQLLSDLGGKAAKVATVIRQRLIGQ